MQTDADTLAARIAALVRERRVGAGLRQDELALAAGISTRTLHAIEHGAPGTRLDTTIRVLGVVGLTLDVLPRHPARNGRASGSEDA